MEKGNCDITGKRKILHTNIRKRSLERARIFTIRSGSVFFVDRYPDESRHFVRILEHTGFLISKERRIGNIK